MEPEQQNSALTKKWFSKSFLKNAGIGAGALLISIIVISVLLGSLNSARDKGTMQYAPEMDMHEEGVARSDSAGSVVYPGMPVPYPEPGNVTDLEFFETTRYSAQARTREFDPACDELESLKQQDEIYFKSLTRSKDSCRASFFSDPGMVDTVLEALDRIDHITITKDISSVTTVKRQIASQLEILNERMQTLESTIRSAEAQYAEIAIRAEGLGNAAELSQAITEKLRVMSQLQNERISLSSQIQSYQKQQAELDERIAHTEFNVSITRAFAYDEDAISRKWEAAWYDLKETLTDVKIGLTAYLGIFLLRVLQFGLYLLILIVGARYVFKFVQFVWRKL